MLPESCCLSLQRFRFGAFFSGNELEMKAVERSDTNPQTTKEAVQMSFSFSLRALPNPTVFPRRLRGGFLNMDGYQQ